MKQSKNVFSSLHLYYKSIVNQNHLKAKGKPGLNRYHFENFRNQSCIPLSYLPVSFHQSISMHPWYIGAVGERGGEESTPIPSVTTEDDEQPIIDQQQQQQQHKALICPPYLSHEQQHLNH